jgi:uncharacterized protein involved in response to NO
MKKPFTILSSAPHRLGFGLGALLLLGSLLLWGFEMWSRNAASPMATTMPAIFWHGYVMVYGFFPLFMLGFIYTAGPRWLNVSSPQIAHYAVVLLGFAAGSLATLAGRWSPSLMLLGIGLHLLAWSLGTAIWWRAIARSSVADKVHALCIAVAFSLGALGMLAALYWLLGQEGRAWQWAIELGVWGLLLPVFLTVSHRMIPFFSQSVLTGYTAWRPWWLLYTLVGCCFVILMLQVMHVNTSPVTLLMGLLLIYTSWRWRLVAAWSVKLLAMLHLAFAWAAIALLLWALSDGLQLVGQNGLGFAPLHALTLGFFCSMLLAFVTRVTLGHSGRPLLAGGLAWATYWLMHGVAAARVLGELIPMWQNALYLAATMLALLAIALWMKVYLPMYWQARIDGKAG